MSSLKVLEEIIATVDYDAPVREVRIGPFWTGVWSRNCGLASTVFEHGHSSRPPVREAGSLTSMTARRLCSYVESSSLLERTVALAALNSLLEVDLGRCREVNAADLLVERGRGKRVCCGPLPLRAAVAGGSGEAVGVRKAAPGG